MNHYRVGSTAVCAAILIFIASCGGGGSGSGTPADTTPPTALIVVPVNGATDIALGAAVSVFFSEPIDCASVTATSFKLAGGGTVAGTPSCAGSGATFTPASPLSVSTTYTVTVSAVRDAAGNAMATPFISTFTTVPVAPAAPTGVAATPGSGLAILSWPAVSGATKYNVYSSPVSPATIGGTRTTVFTPSITLPVQPNGTPVFLAVTAANAGGESGLSNQVCAVPTFASTANVTLYDPLCGNTLDGKKWSSSLFSYGVENNALALTSRVANMEPRTVKGLTYQTLASVVTGGQRVTTLRADITVPATNVSRTGTAEIRAIVRLTYQPPALRLNSPGGSQDQIALEIGLRDAGSGLEAYRTLRHCDSANCTSRSTTDIAITNPAGFTETGSGIEVAAAAAYDTKYTVTASLDESTGVLAWSIAGGTFGGAPGTADPGVYLAGNSNWNALGASPLSTGGGFVSAQIGTRAFEDSDGSDASVSAKFENVRVGFNNAAATLFDDFGGTPPNSGPTELSSTKWSTPGGSPAKSSAALTGGKLVTHAQATSPGINGVANLQVLSLNNPASINTLQADVTISACSSPPVGVGLSNRVELQGVFYNDGSPGTTPPNINQANSSVGDIRAFLRLECATNTANFTIVRYVTQTTFVTLSVPANSQLLSAGIVGTHTMGLSWDPALKLFTFQVDGGTVIVDPTTVNAFMNTPAPVVKPANSPTKLLLWGGVVGASPSSAGVVTSIDATFNNVFTAP